MLKTVTHEHKYVIPVEWIYWGTANNHVSVYHPQGKVVTKLRCECGEEIIR